MSDTARTTSIPLLNLTRAAEDTEAGAATLTEDQGYEFSGIAVPFGEEYARWEFREAFDPACIFDGLDTAKVFWRHDEVIGKVTGSESTDLGLMIDAKISHTQLGDEAATLIRDGVIDRLSIGFDGIEYTATLRDDGTELWTWTHVRIREVSLVPNPAYESAALTEVRHHPRQKVGTMPRTTEDQATLTREDFDDLRAELGEQIRATQVQIATLGDRTDPAPARFRSFGEFIRAYHTGDAEARSMYESFREAAATETLHQVRAYNGGVLADAIARDQWVGDAIRLIDKGRPVLNSFGTAPLPAEGTKLEYGVLESNTVNVDKQADEGDELAKGKVTVGTDFATVGTFGGWSELSFQTVERASVNMLDLTRRAQLIAYAQQTEAEVRALLAATISGNIAANHNLDAPALADLTAADWISLLIDASDAFQDAALPIDGLWLSKDVFKALATLEDSTGRLVFEVFGSGTNAVGKLDAPQADGLEAQLASLRVRMLPGAAAGTAAFYNSQAITTWENAGAPVALEDSNVTNLTRAYSVYGYLATAAEIPDAILPVAFEV